MWPIPLLTWMCCRSQTQRHTDRHRPTQTDTDRHRQTARELMSFCVRENATMTYSNDDRIRNVEPAGRDLNLHKNVRYASGAEGMRQLSTKSWSRGHNTGYRGRPKLYIRADQLGMAGHETSWHTRIHASGTRAIATKRATAKTPERG